MSTISDNSTLIQPTETELHSFLNDSSENISKEECLLQILEESPSAMIIKRAVMLVQLSGIQPLFYCSANANFDFPSKECPHLLRMFMAKGYFSIPKEHSKNETRNYCYIKEFLEFTKHHPDYKSVRIEMVRTPSNLIQPELIVDKAVPIFLSSYSSSHSN